MIIDDQPSLYNLSEDIEESRDIQDEHHQKFQELMEDLNHWESNLEEEIKAF